MLFTPGKFCEICSTKDVKLGQCSMCGSFICADCVSKVDKICGICFEARCQICQEYPSSRACDKCGILVCEDHGIRVNEATTCDTCRMNEE